MEVLGIPLANSMNLDELQGEANQAIDFSDQYFFNVCSVAVSDF